MFVNRAHELAFLSQTLNRTSQGSLVLLYGRRRVGKTELLRQWATNNDLPYTYWMAEKEPPLWWQLYTSVLISRPDHAQSEYLNYHLAPPKISLKWSSNHYVFGYLECLSV